MGKDYLGARETKEFVDPRTGQYYKAYAPKPDTGGGRFVRVYRPYFRATVRASSTAIDVMAYLAMFITSEMSNINTSKDVRRYIAERLECSMSKVDKGIKDLVDARILIRSGRNDYHINPRMLWLGSENRRKAAINRLPVGWDYDKGNE